ncbi:hypothetical protein FC756_22345 [Lysinibacillus mangiferihumi]|uniref:Uncharacterized protein n=1 Tax=Lysinibacillus mangiferihumi TaxID=1130819 RepID=A0A4U2Y1B0_9BACI|nr:hypothetical protein [Lysinibacillus mangiferihumi]TKI53774.1 hypothetical protein FC756_22345 [Lysinibacillus mangiferihumi]
MSQISTSGKYQLKSKKINVIQNKIKPLIGKKKLSTLDKESYKRNFIWPLLKQYKPSSVRYYHLIFNTAINAAVDSEIISRNRFNKVNFHEDDYDKPNVLNI